MGGRNWFWKGFILVSLLALSACGKPETEGNTPARRITFVSPVANDGYWGQAALAILEEAEAQGISVKCVGTALPDVPQQILNIRSAISSGVDGIITSGISGSQDFLDALLEAKEAGIPVVLIDTDAENAERVCYVGTDNRGAGRIAAQQLAAMTGGEARIAIVTANRDVLNQEERLAGFQEELAGYPGMKQEFCLDHGKTVVLLKGEILTLLEEHPEIDALFCMEGFSSRAACRILDEFPTRFKDLHAVVFDVNTDTKPALQKGLSVAILEQDPRRMGREAVRILAGVTPGEDWQQEDILLDPSCVTLQNVEEAQEYITGNLEWYLY